MNKNEKKTNINKQGSIVALFKIVLLILNCDYIFPMVRFIKQIKKKSSKSVIWQEVFVLNEKKKNKIWNR